MGKTGDRSIAAPFVRGHAKPACNEPIEQRARSTSRWKARKRGIATRCSSVFSYADELPHDVAERGIDFATSSAHHLVCC
jgi:hypothetical protein